MSKRSQAALEFLMTYGWAIIVVLVVIGALSYFGVFNPRNLLPSKCVVQPPFTCQDSVRGNDGIGMLLQNSAGEGITINSLTFTSDAINGTCSSGTISAYLNGGDQAFIYAKDPACVITTTKGKMKFNVNIGYTTQRGMTHTIQGSIITSYESSTAVSEIKLGGQSIGGSSSLVGYWSFEEGTGTTTADKSNNSDTGTLQNFACTTLDCNPSSGWTSAGKRGNALVFNGVNNYVDMGNTTNLDISGSQITMAAWVYYKGNFTGTYMGILERGAAAQYGLRLWISSPNIYVKLIGSGGEVFNWVPGITGGVGAVTINNWTYVTLTFNRPTLNLYVNGVSVATTNWNYDIISKSNISFQIGTIQTISKWFYGSIDEVQLYNRALSASEVSTLYNSYS